jgi:hypothetical protein
LTNRALREALQKRLGNVTPDAIYKRAQKVKRERGPMTTEDAVNLMAADAGIDVNKYLDPGSLERVRQLRQATGTVATASHARRSLNRPGSKTVRVFIGGAMELTDPLLSEKTLREAKLMADKVYPLLYILENSIRQFIVRTLAAVHGDAWWTTVPTDTKRKVQSRKDKEGSMPWHGRRGVHEVYYTDLDDLKKIITSDVNWPHFENLLRSQQWIRQRLEEIETSRNVIAHSNPLARHDLDRLVVYFGDWQRQIEGVQDQFRQPRRA